MTELTRRERLLAQFPLDLDYRTSSNIIHQKVSDQVGWQPFRLTWTLRSQVEGAIEYGVRSTIREMMP